MFSLVCFLFICIFTAVSCSRGIHQYSVALTCYYHLSELQSQQVVLRWCEVCGVLISLIVTDYFLAIVMIDKLKISCALTCHLLVSLYSSSSSPSCVSSGEAWRRPAVWGPGPQGGGAGGLRVEEPGPQGGGARDLRVEVAGHFFQ